VTKLIFFFIFLLFSNTAWAADRYASIGLDYNFVQIKHDTIKHSFEWQGIELVYTEKWEDNKLLISGWRVGARKHNLHRWEREAYIHAGLFRDVEDLFTTGNGSWDLRLGAQAVYGIPGFGFNRTTEVHEDGELVGYHRTYLVTNVDIPAQRIDEAGVLYPMVTFSLVGNFKRLNVEPIVGLRGMRFGIEKAINHELVELKEDIYVVPTYGLRVGWKF